MANKEYHHLYNSKQWKAIRASHLQNNPLCVMCSHDGYTTEAKIVDHINPHRGDLELFYNGPFQSLCKTHHDSIKQRQEKSGLLFGGDESGKPIDSNHHWNTRG